MTTTVSTILPGQEANELRQLRLLSIQGTWSETPGSVPAENGEGEGGRELHGHCYFGKVPLALETFLRIADFVESDNLVAMSQVNFAWKKGLLGSRRTWRVLEVDVGRKESIQKSREWTKRASGHLGVLVVRAATSYAYGLDDEDQPLCEVLRRVLEEIRRHDGGRRLESVTLDLQAYGFEHSLPALRLISRLANFIELGAINVRRFRIKSDLGPFPSGAPFFHSLPGLRDLAVTGGTGDEHVGMGELPEFFRLSDDTQASSCRLRKLSLAHTTLPDPRYPSFPFLRTLELANVEVPNLYSLLKSCSPALRTLKLWNVTAGVPSEQYPFNASTPRDLPPVLFFPHLDSVEIYENTPLLWDTPKPASSTFSISGPFLRSVDFAGEIVSGDEFGTLGVAETYNAGWDYEPIVGLTLETLTSLFRTSPQLKLLNLSGTGVTSPMLKSALRYAPQLELLRVDCAPGIDDDLIDALFPLAPNLKGLSVFCNEEEISVQALSRLANRHEQDARGTLLVIAASKSFLNDPLPPSPPILPTLRSTLRALLITLSLSQVEHLANSVPLNPPAHFPSFQQVKDEIIALGSPDPLPPFPRNKDEARMRNWTLELKRMPATEDILIAARKGLAKWQLRREQEAATRSMENNRYSNLFWDEYHFVHAQ